MSATLTRIRSAVTPMRRDINELQTELNALNRTKVSLQVDMERAKRELADARRAFRELGDEANATRLDQAQEQYNALADQLREVSRASRQTIRDMEETTSAIGRADNRASRAGGGSAVSSGGSMSIMQMLGAVGAGQMLGNLLTNAGGLAAASAFGSEAGNLLSGGLGGAVSGAMAGFALGGPVGAAVGGLAGTVTGIANAATENWEKRDDAFKAYYTGILDDQAAARSEAITAGSALASGRETNLVSFSTLYGSEAVAANYLDKLVDMANTTPFLYDDLVQMSKTLATYGYTANNTLPVLRTVGDAGAALGMSTSDMSMVAQALGRMKSSDKTTLEYLNILNDRGIGAVGMLAEAKGMSVGEVYTAISKGQLSGRDSVDIILKAMEESFAGSMEEQSKTFAGKSSTLTGLRQETQVGYGEGYNDQRMAGMQAEIDALGGPLGEALKQHGEVEGALAAYRENLQEQYTREALEALMTGKETTLKGLDDETLQRMSREYKDYADQYAKGSMEAGLKMQNLKDEAEGLAKAAYDSSEWAKKELTAQEELTQAMRDLAGAFDGWEMQYEAQLARTMGIVAARANTYYNHVEPEAFVRDEAGNAIMDESGVFKSVDYSSPMSDRPDPNVGLPPGFAVGLRRVPYDNFPAYLHEGERVLTAQEARQRDKGGGIVVNITMNGTTVREEADVQRIGQAMCDEILIRLQAAQK